MMQWTVRLEVRTSQGEVTTSELVTFSRPGVVSTLAEIGLMLAETKTLLAKLQASMLCGQVAEHTAHHRVCGIHPVKAAYQLARIIHEKCAVKAKPLISFTTMRMGCLMKFFAMKSLAQVFGGLGRFRAVR